MRVAHINTYHNRGGAGAASRRLHSALRAEGVDSVYVCAEGNDVLPQVKPSVVPLSGMRRIYWKMAKTLDIQFSSLVGPDGDWRAGLFGVNPPPRRFDADLLHLHWVQHGFLSLGQLVRLSSCLPIVWTLHDLWPLTDGGAFVDGDVSSFRRKKTKMVSELNPYWIAPSQFVADRAIAMGATPLRLSVLPNAVAMDVFSGEGAGGLRRELNIRASDRICVCSAIVESGSHVKGCDLLFDLLISWGERKPQVGVVFVVIGNLDTRISELPHVRQVSPIQDEKKMSEIYADSDFFLSTSRFESFGLMVVEAQASGLPVVAFDVAAIPEVTRSGVTSFLASPFSVDSLLSKISECLERLESDANIKEKCRQFAVDHFCSRIVANAHGRLYESLLGE